SALGEQFARGLLELERIDRLREPAVGTRPFREPCVLGPLEQDDHCRRLGKDLELARETECAEWFGSFVGDHEVVVALLTSTLQGFEAVRRLIDLEVVVERTADPRARALASRNDQDVHPAQSYPVAVVGVPGPTCLTPLL